MKRQMSMKDQVLSLLERAGDGLAPIVEAGDPVLRAVAEPYDGQFDEKTLTALAQLMRRTMLAAPGVGLAAPQVGLSLALAVVEDPGPGHPELSQAREREPLPFRVLVNPRYEAVDNELVGFYEACLSVPGYTAVVNRPRRVHVTGYDESGTALDEVISGWAGRIIQHETDHLNGVLYLDVAEMRSLGTAGGWGGHWAVEPRPLTAAAELGFVLL